jgi:hypothetical protein
VAASETGGGGAGCNGLPLCDDFEADTAATPPTGWNVVMGCNPMGTPNAPVAGGITVGIDSSQHHSGNNSLRVVGGDPCGYYAVNTSAFTGGKLGQQVYGRYWAMFSLAPTANHNGFMSMATNTNMGTNPNQLRLGFQGNVIVWNWYGNDSTMPDIDPAGEMQSVAPMANTWVCLEFHVDQTNGHIEFWYQNASSTTAGLTFTGGTPATGVNDQWAASGPKAPVLTSLGLGYLHLNDVMTVWFDDVALGNSRIGCN